MEMLTSALAPERKGAGGNTQRLCKLMMKLSKDLEIWEHSVVEDKSLCLSYTFKVQNV